MSSKIESVKQLRHVILVYNDGTAIKVPENNALEVGTAFMKAVAEQKFQWEVLVKSENLLGKIKDWFRI